MAKKEMTRKEFLKGSAATAAGVAAFSLLGGCATAKPRGAAVDANSGATPEPVSGGASKPAGADWLGKEPKIAESAIKETWDTDIVVVGAGTGGMAAICSAVENGAKAILIERNETSPGIKDDIGAIGSRFQKAEGVSIDPQEMIGDMVRYAGGHIDQRLHQVWARESGAMLDWYADRLAEKGIKIWLENSAGTPGTRDKDWVTGHSPVWTKEIPKGNFVLQPYAEAHGAVFHYSTAMVKLEKKGGRVVGLIAQKKDGSYVRVRASKGVILSTGGYARNPDMMAALQPQTVPLYSFSTAGATLGDGIKAALWAGAAMDTVHTSMLFDRCAIKPGELSGPQTKGSLFWMGSQPFLKVNLRGERFANESGPYDYILHEASTQPGNCYCTIWDADYREDVRRFDTVGCSRLYPFGNGAPTNFTIDQIVGMNEGLIAAGFIQKADSLEELAAKLQIPAQAFAASVARYNALAEQGRDEDFGKPAFRLSRIQKAPFYGVRNTGSMLCTLDGIRIDTDMRALDPAGNPIPGLFMCGNDSGGYYAVTYPNLSTGNACGRTMTFARRAARIAAKEA
jgi:hypothetical protein